MRYVLLYFHFPGSPWIHLCMTRRCTTPVCSLAVTKSSRIRSTRILKRKSIEISLNILHPIFSLLCFLFLAVSLSHLKHSETMPPEILLEVPPFLARTMDAVEARGCFLVRFWSWNWQTCRFFLVLRKNMAVLWGLFSCSYGRFL